MPGTGFEHGEAGLTAQDGDHHRKPQIGSHREFGVVRQLAQRVGEVEVRVVQEVGQGREIGGQGRGDVHEGQCSPVTPRTPIIRSKAE